MHRYAVQFLKFYSKLIFFSFQSLKLFTIDNSKHKNRIYPNKDPYHVRELKKKKIKIKNKSQKIAI